MSKKRDWFIPINGTGFYIVVVPKDEKPYHVVERYYGGYRTGMTTSHHGFYSDLETAKRRVRYLESR